MRQNHKIPRVFQLLMKDAWFSKSSNEKVLYLTFDDGPHLEFTPLILEVLESFQAKASFFCLGKNVVQYPEVFQKIIYHQHSVGNHCYTHLNGVKSKSNIYVDDVKKASKNIESNLFRPPYGQITPAIYRQLKRDYQFVFWDVMPGDFMNGITSDLLIENTIKQVKNGSIIVFHDQYIGQKNLLPALKYLLQYYSGLGYQFLGL
jgi:peptidoglycan/xylan/chitin deacetylase (PgdA/CDA1 family)